MTEARERILARLRANRPQATPAVPRYEKALGWDRARCIAEFSQRMQAVRGEVHQLRRSEWIDWLNQELPARALTRVLLGRSGQALQFAAQADATLQLHHYERPIEDWKAELFRDIDVALTGSVAGLAESGSLVLWPDAGEPRLMSLVPPVHIALLDSARIFENFAQLIGVENWAAGMPTNALLISGPSKTADIEQTLAYGIHGPEQLITLILD